MKQVLKGLLDVVSIAVVLPPFGAYRLGGALLGRERVFPGWSQAFGMVPGLTGVYLRRAFYRLVLPRCGRDCCLSFGTVLSHDLHDGHIYIGLHMLCPTTSLKK